MNHFSIKDIERMSGIKAHTLRIWEQRYGLSFCKRKESKHRYFDNEDLKEILGVAHLYHQGYKISKIATLSKDEIRQIAHEPSATEIFPAYVDQMIVASIDYNEGVFEKVIEQATAKFGFEETVLKVIYPFLEKIGLLWLTGHVIPAQEHFSSCLIQKKIITAIQSFDLAITSGQEMVAVFAPENEFHELPLLMMSYLLKSRGIRTRYFGTNVCISTIEYYASHKNITHLCCHMITNFLQFEADQFIAVLREKFPRINIILSGPAFQNCQPGMDNVTVLGSLHEIWEIGSLIKTRRG